MFETRTFTFKEMALPKNIWDSIEEKSDIVHTVAIRQFSKVIMIGIATQKN